MERYTVTINYLFRSRSDWDVNGSCVVNESWSLEAARVAFDGEDQRETFEVELSCSFPAAMRNKGYEVLFEAETPDGDVEVIDAKRYTWDDHVADR